jgi:hypothetical protein
VSTIQLLPDIESYAEEVTHPWEARMRYVVAAAWDQFAAGLSRATLCVGDVTFQAVVALTPEQRVQGMIGRGYVEWDAMLFVQPLFVSVAFHNKGVPQSTHLAAFDANGVLVGQHIMDVDDGAHVVLPPHLYTLERPGIMGLFANSDVLDLSTCPGVTVI